MRILDARMLMMASLSLSDLVSMGSTVSLSTPLWTDKPVKNCEPMRLTLHHDFLGRRGYREQALIGNGDESATFSGGKSEN